jgi:hypothetical protein
MESPVYDLIVRNIDDLLPSDDVETKESNRAFTKIGAIKIRAQAKAETQIKPMKVPPSIDLWPTDLKQSQKEDKSHTKAWDMEARGEIKNSGKNNTYRYFKKEGILYRKFESPHHQSFRAIHQLVVPIKYRKNIMKMAHERF